MHRSPQLQQCVIGCANGQFPLLDIFAAAATACRPDPAGGCEAYAAGLRAYCATAPNPPTACVQDCFDPTCVARCTETGNCAQAAQMAVDGCRAMYP